MFEGVAVLAAIVAVAVLEGVAVLVGVLLASGVIVAVAVDVATGCVLLLITKVRWAVVALVAIVPRYWITSRWLVLS